MGIDLSLTNAGVFMLLSALLPLLFLALIRPQAFSQSKGQALIEMGYHFVADILIQNGVPGAQKGQGLGFFPLVASVFVFILFGNMLGMLPYSFTFTSHIVATFGLAGLLFLIITGIGIARHGKKFLRTFFPPGVPLLLAPLMIPVEVLSYLSKPLSLSVRLFANMMAGHTMLKVFGGFTVALGFLGVAPLAINVALIGFELLVSFLQAYVFTILTCIYLADALYLHGEDH